MESYDDDFTPEGVSRHIITLMIGIILVTAVFIPVFWGLTGETVIHENNGTGLNMPLGYDNGNPLNGQYTVTLSDETISIDGEYAKVIGEGDDAERYDGSYHGTIGTDKDAVILLTNNSALFVSDGKLIWYNGTSSAEVTSVTLSIANGIISGTSYSWIYLPDSNGTFRTYDSAVPYDTDNKATGIAYGYDTTIISVNNNATNQNDVIVAVEREDGGINKITYIWSDIQ